MLCVGLLVLSCYGIATDVFLKTVLVSLTLGVFTPVAWFLILNPQERHFLRGKLNILTLSALRNRT
jgi:hypothetical protein